MDPISHKLNYSLNTTLYQQNQTSSTSSLPPEIISSIEIPTADVSSLKKRSITQEKDRKIKQKGEELKKEMVEMDTLLYEQPDAVWLLEDLAMLVNNPNNYNVILDLDGKKFYAHREILASRSPMFRGLLFGFYKENEQSTIKLIPVTTPKIFEKILFYIYTGQIEITLNDLLLIYLEADYYELQELKELCINTFTKELNEENAFNLLIKTHAHPGLDLFYNEVLLYCLHDESLFTSYDDLPEKIANDIALLNDSPLSLNMNGNWMVDQAEPNLWFESKLENSQFLIKPCGEREAILFIKIDPVNHFRKKTFPNNYYTNDPFYQTSFYKKNETFTFELGNKEWELKIGQNSDNGEDSELAESLIANTNCTAIVFEIQSKENKAIAIDGRIVRLSTIREYGRCFLEKKDLSNTRENVFIHIKKRDFHFDECGQVNIYSKNYNIKHDPLFFQINIKLRNKNHHPSPCTVSHCTNAVFTSLMRLSDTCNEEANSLAFQCEDEVFFVYRSFLKQRAPIFYHSLNLQESRYYPDIEKNLFQIFLNYIYTGKLTLNTIERGRDLYLLAHRFKMDNLLASCNQFLKTEVSIHNAFGLLEKIDREKEAKLYKEIIKKIARNARNIFIEDNRDFIDLEPLDFFEILKSSLLNLREEEVIKGTALWLESKPNWEQLLEQAKQYLRPSLIHLRNLWMIVSKVKVNGQSFFSSAELHEMSINISEKKKIHKEREVKIPWLLPITDTTFYVQKDQYAENETIVYWQIPLFLDEDLNTREVLETKSNRYELRCQYDAHEYDKAEVYFTVKKISEKTIASIEGYLVTEEDFNSIELKHKNKNDDTSDSDYDSDSDSDSDDPEAFLPYPLLHQRQRFGGTPIVMLNHTSSFSELYHKRFIFNNCLHVQVRIQEF